MRIVYDNYIRIYKSKDETIEALQELLTFKNPAHGYALARQKQGKFLPEMPPKYLRCFEVYDDHIGLPTGFNLNIIKHLARNNKELIQIIDNRSVGHEIDFKLSTDGHFRGFEDYQERIIQNAINKPNSVTSSPTGSGKTVSAFGIIEQLKMSTIVLVNRKDLVEQWIEEIGAMCSGEFTIGQFGAGKKKLGDIVIATVQTLTRLNLKSQEDLKNRFGLVIVDEVHLASAPTFTKASSMFSSKYKIGLSATPYRKDKKEFMFKTYIGPVTLKIDDSEVEETGRIVPMKYEFIDTGYSLDYDDIENDLDRLPQTMLSDYDRTKFVVECVLRDIEMGFVPLVISNRVPHLKNIHKLLQESGLKSGLIIGAVGPNERKEIRHEMKAGNYDVLVANEKIFGTGMNIPILSSVHICFYTNNKTLLKQISGRVRRSYAGKTYAKVVYYRDDIYTLETNKRTLEGVKLPVSSVERTYTNVLNYFLKWGFTCEHDNSIFN